jgi:hypothetical protein
MLWLTDVYQYTIYVNCRKISNLFVPALEVPDSYRATERNSSSISADVTDESNENY